MKITRAFLKKYRYESALFFLLALAFLPSLVIYIYGGPPRFSMFVLTLIFIAAGFIPLYLSMPLLGLVLIADVILTICFYFYLTPNEILLSLRYSYMLGIYKDIAYVITLLAVCAIAALMFYTLTRVRRYARFNARLLTLVFVSGALLQFLSLEIATTENIGDGISEPAITASRLDKILQTTQKRDVVFTIVESLGAFRDKGHRDLIWGSLKGDDISKDYEIFEGLVNFKGATLAAESRELCNNTVKPLSLEEKADQCIPAKMQAKGYQTLAVNGFSEKFFGGSKWYPLIGFEDLYFMENLKLPQTRYCGGVFESICDILLAGFIEGYLESAEGPQFVYWLTINTHVPVKPGDGTPRFDCEENGGPFAHRSVCSTAELWIDVSDGIAKLAHSRPRGDKPILFLVGDHGLPMHDRAGQDLFIAGKVPWILLVPKKATKELALAR